jgi:hypothetical protein
LAALFSSLLSYWAELVCGGGGGRWACFTFFATAAGDFLAFLKFEEESFLPPVESSCFLFGALFGCWAGAMFRFALEGWIKGCGGGPGCDGRGGAGCGCDTTTFGTMVGSAFTFFFGGTYRAYSEEDIAAIVVGC